MTALNLDNIICNRNVFLLQRTMNVMKWESKRNDFLIWTRLCYANGAVYMLSRDRVSLLWFWLSNCLVLQLFRARF